MNPKPTFFRRLSKPVLAAQFALVMLVITALACTSNDTLFIKLTATASPTITITPLDNDVVTKFRLDDVAYVAHVSEFGGTEAYKVPNSADRTQAVIGQCIAGTKVTVKNVAISQVAGDNTTYYSVDCGSGTIGWLPDYNLTSFSKNSSAYIKSADGSGAIVYKAADGKDASGGKNCADGTKVLVQKIILNQDTKGGRGKLYFQIKCGTPKNVWITEDSLTKTAP